MSQPLRTRDELRRRIPLSAHPETALVPGFLHVDLDAGDRGAGRADPAPVDHSLHGVGLAFEHGFDPAVGEVAHPPVDVRASGFAPAGVAEEHALHLAVDDDPPPYGHRLAVASSRRWANFSVAAVRRVGTCSVGVSTGWYCLRAARATVTRCTSSGPS